MSQKPDESPIPALAAVAQSFGAEAVAQKTRLLEEILAAERYSAPELRQLLALVCYLQAYPDNSQILGMVRQVAAQLRVWGTRVRGGANSSALWDIGFPGGCNYYGYALPVIRQLQRAFPGCLEMDWEEFEGSAILQNCLGVYVTPAECAGLDSVDLTMKEWIAAAKDPGLTDLEFLVEVFSAAGPGPIAAEILWDACDVVVRYDLSQVGTGRSEVLWPIDKVCYQRRPINNKRLPLAKAIRQPLAQTKALAKALAKASGRAFIDFALASLCARNLEIRMLMYCNPAEVYLADCGRGLQVALIGVVPEYRDALEINYCSLVVKNGITIAYGPVSLHFGRCEMGLNLFPEFRSGEINWIYPQFMRAIHHVLGANYFFLTPYAMGDGNNDALHSGAFWFYRKLGFLAVESEIEALAQLEERKMREQPGYRCDLRTLRRLAPTAAYFDMAETPRESFDLAAIGVRLSRIIAAEFAGDRAEAEVAWMDRVAGVLDLPAPRTDVVTRALRLLAPLLCGIDGFDQWSQADQRLMRRIILAKSARTEVAVDSLLRRHATFQVGLRSLGQAR